MVIALTDTYQKSFDKLGGNEKKLATESLSLFSRNPSTPSLNYEHLHDSELQSIRFSHGGRVIIDYNKGGNIVYVYFATSQHDKAYEFSRGRSKDEFLHELEIAEGLIPDESKSVETPGIFSFITNEQLTALEVPDSMFDYIRSIKTKEQFYTERAGNKFPDTLAEKLEFIAEGESVKTVIESFTENSIPEEQTDDTELFIDNTKYITIDTDGCSDKEIDDFLNMSLDKWRVYLHPTQMKIVNANFNGPARVLGSAGTGKTIVAMYRVKRLLRELQTGEKIFVTTYNKALEEDISTGLQKLCNNDEYHKLRIQNIDAYIFHVLKKEVKLKDKICYDTNQYWMKAIENVNPVQKYELNFYMNEWTEIAANRCLFSKDKYLTVDRRGQEHPLSSKQREEIWKVFEEYQRILSDNAFVDKDYAKKICLDFLREEERFKHIIVDEAQDFSPLDLMILRKLAGAEHRNDIFITGDSHQRIYRSKYSLKDCGINIRGKRSASLRINYRTTEEIRNYAFSIFKGLEFDDLDGNILSNELCRSVTSGDIPEIMTFQTDEEELHYISEKIRELYKSGVSYRDICIISRSRKFFNKYVDGLKGYEIPSLIVNDTESDKNIDDGIRISTMHRSKGLEFKYVFLVNANKGVIPKDDKDCISERSLTYVALTRAQKGVFITSVGKLSEYFSQ